ncbi:MAG TPA: DUF6338 family protein [Kribbella sp.]|nr:DUF6338 family protein [Kribbella sp.]
MLPSTMVGLLVLVAALSPGLVRRRLVTRYVQRDSRSSVAEVVELATAGAFTSVIAAIATLVLGQFVPFLVSLGEFVGDPAGLRAHPWRVVLSLVVSLGLSFALASLSGYLWARRVAEVSAMIREGTVWAGVLSVKRDGKPAFLAVELDDGRLAEGYFRAVSVAEDVARDALVLRRPIAISGPANSPRTVVDEDFLLIPRSGVKVVHGKYVDQPRTANDRRLLPDRRMCAPQMQGGDTEE